ncbi:hypothetical protein VTJ04DRAFT_3291 [Mycothermus thermophilus]|uniref:uncharacterized protein n=1 Tax=Humicola insolens TaxID=85995 RepID=UPI00374341CC
MDGVGIDQRRHAYHQPSHPPPHQHHQQFHHGSFGAQHPLNQHALYNQQLPPDSPLLRMQRKRKADAPPENNERLSKRMSRLNLENSTHKLHVTVEDAEPEPPVADNAAATAAPSSVPSTSPKPKKSHRSRPVDDSIMQLDDSKYKVYIYNLDDELSSSDNESDASAADDKNNKVIFHPDVEKHLRANRIPTHVLDPRPDPRSEMAGKELVLYSEPTSLSVPVEHDSVRKAIIEARARARERQRLELEMANAARQGLTPPLPPPSTPKSAASTPVTPPSPVPSQLGGVVAMEAEPVIPQPPRPLAPVMDDPDAMELD